MTWLKVLFFPAAFAQLLRTTLRMSNEHKHSISRSWNDAKRAQTMDHCPSGRGKLGKRRTGAEGGKHSQTQTQRRRENKAIAKIAK